MSGSSLCSFHFSKPGVKSSSKRHRLRFLLGASGVFYLFWCALLKRAEILRVFKVFILCLFPLNSPNLPQTSAVRGHPSGTGAVRLLQDRHQQAVSERGLWECTGQHTHTPTHTLVNEYEGSS